MCIQLGTESTRMQVRPSQCLWLTAHMNVIMDVITKGYGAHPFALRSTSEQSGLVFNENMLMPMLTLVLKCLVVCMSMQMLSPRTMHCVCRQQAAYGLRNQTLPVTAFPATIRSHMQVHHCPPVMLPAGV